MAGIWLEWFGGPASMGLKILGAILWGGTSILFSVGSRRMREVWLDGPDLLVLTSGRWVRVPLEDVTGMTENRGQKVKTIKLTLRPGSTLGTTVRFIPLHRFQAPFTEHPLIGELKERKRLLSGGSGNRNLHP